jgi:YD repeat-containing protein
VPKPNPRGSRREAHGFTSGERTGTQYSYNSNGKVSIKGPYHTGGFSGNSVPNSTTITYDETTTGEPVQWVTSYQDIDGSNGTLTKRVTQFDSGFRPTTIVDEMGVSTSYSYDIYGRQLNINRSGEEPITISYPDYWTKRTQQGLKTTVEEFDGFGRPTRTTLPDGRQIIPTYDMYGRIINIKEIPASTPCGTAITPRNKSTEYDELDRIKSITEFDGLKTTYNYSNDGYHNIETRTLVNAGLTTVIKKDPFGQVTSIQKPNGDLSSYTFDGLGNTTSTTIQSDNVSSPQTRTFTYDTLGRLVSKVEPETNVQTFTNFNALNQALLKIEGALSLSPRQTAMKYDGLGRLRSRSNNNTSEIFTYVGAFLKSKTRTAGTDVIHKEYVYDSNSAKLRTETTTGTVIGPW